MGFFKMGLLRLGIVVAVGVALLPSDSEQQEMLYNRAALAAQWTITFCDRNKESCDQAGELWGAFKKKAQFAAGLAYDTLSEQIASSINNTDNTGGIAPAEFGRNTATPRVLETGTLKPLDLEPGWRGGPNSSHVKTQGRLVVRGHI